MSQKKELLYDELPLGREFPTFVYPVTRELVQKFIATVEDKNPLYWDEEYAKKSGYKGILAPHSIAGIYGRLAYLGEEYTMPVGGFLTKLEFEYLNPVFVGDTLTARAKVIENYIKKERKNVTFEISTENQEGVKVSVVRIYAVWPK